MPKTIFSKKEFQMWDFESFIFLSRFSFFERTALRCFSQYFLIFKCRPAIVADICMQTPLPPHPPFPCLIHTHHKKTSCGTVIILKNHYRLIAIDLHRQKEVDVDPKAIQQIEFVGQLRKTR